MIIVTRYFTLHTLYHFYPYKQSYKVIITISIDFKINFYMSTYLELIAWVSEFNWQVFFFLNGKKKG